MTKRKGKKREAVLVDTWKKCYGESWTGIISPSSFSHPAKFSRALIRKIYDHATEEGWAFAGSRVVDPFGGVALGAYEAMQRGMHWSAVELELRFCDLGQGFDCAGFTKADWRRFQHRIARVNLRRGIHFCPTCVKEMEVGPQKEVHGLFSTTSSRHVPFRESHRSEGNIDLWKKKGFKGTARLINGDSRKLRQVLSAADIGVTSPPYVGALGNTKNYADPEKARNDANREFMQHQSSTYPDLQYGAEEGQLGSMKEGDHDLAVSSPPFGSSTQTEHRAENLTAGKARRGGDAAMRVKQDYAELNTEGNLAQLQANEEGLDLALSSPPYAGNSGKHDHTGHERAQRRADEKGFKQGLGCFKASEAYGDEPGQLGRMDEGNLDLAVSSPPHVHPPGKGGVSARFDQMADEKGLHDPAYGNAPGQISEMPVGDLDLALTSPPYINSVNAGDHGVDWTKVDQDNPNNKGRKRGEGTKHGKRLRSQLAYTENPDPGNLGAMGPGNHADACISSPPYPQPHSAGGGINVDGYTKDWQRNDLKDMVGRRTYQGRGGDRAEGNLEILEGGAKAFDGAVTSPPYEACHVTGERNFLGGGGNETAARGISREGYGVTEGNLGKMKGLDFEAAVTSPPFMNSGTEGDGRKEVLQKRYNASGAKGARPNQVGDYQKHSYADSYGDVEANLGNQRSETFWSASRVILEELFAVLKPGSHAIFVVKMFARDKKLVDFPGQWATLCKAVGFQLLHDHHALLTEEHGSQHTLEGGVDTKRTEKKSFFRRLYEKKNPSNSIDYENVLCFLRP